MDEALVMNALINKNRIFTCGTDIQNVDLDLLATSTDVDRQKLASPGLQVAIKLGSGNSTRSIFND